MTRLVWAAGLALCLVGSPALANGRYPHAQRLKELSPDTLLLAGTYGFVVSTNAGTDWQFVCETLLFGRSSTGSWIDPLFELLADGTIVSGSQHALRVSRDLGCSFATDMTLPVDPYYFSSGLEPNTVGNLVDLTPVAAKGAQHLLALATLNDAQGYAFEHRLYETNDGAVTWQPVGTPIPVSMGNPVFTVDVAPSDATRIYVSAALADSFLLFRSIDSAANWEPLPIAVDDATAANGAYIAAVSPTNPDQLYVRVPRWMVDEEGLAHWDDSLLLSSNAGESFGDVLRQWGNLLGFALSPDGSAVLAGFGDPIVAPIYVDTSVLGLYRANVTDHVFSHVVPSLAVSCISWTNTALYVCANDRDPLGNNPAVDFHVGRTTLANPASAADFEPILKLKDIRGPMPWSDGTSNVCNAEWLTGDPEAPDPASACSTLNACQGGAIPLSAGATVCGANLGGAGGAAGGAGGGGGGGAAGEGGGLGGQAAGTGGNGGASAGATSGAPPSGSSGAAGEAPRAASDGSCGCRMTDPSRSFAGLLAPLAWWVLRRRRSLRLA